MRRLVALLYLGLTILASGSILAQETSTEESYLNIISNPSGATVHLKGEYTLIVTAPASLNQKLNGEYKVRAFKRGYEKWSSRVWFGERNPRQLVIGLEPKTRIKAGMRSLLIPGWGQFYCEEKGKGFIMSISTLGAVAAYVFADNDYSNKYDDYNWAKNQLNNAGNIEDRKRYKQLLDERQREAYDAENLRNVTLGIAIGVWAYNFLDAVLFFPYGQEQFLASGNMSLRLRQDRPTLLFTKKF